MNWPIQSAGSDLMRIVCIAATEAVHRWSGLTSS
jgi:hypothetical protein